MNEACPPLQQDSVGPQQTNQSTPPAPTNAQSPPHTSSSQQRAPAAIPLARAGVARNSVRRSQRQDRPRALRPPQPPPGSGSHVGPPLAVRCRGLPVPGLRTKLLDLSRARPIHAPATKQGRRRSSGRARRSLRSCPAAAAGITFICRQSSAAAANAPERGGVRGTSQGTHLGRASLCSEWGVGTLLYVCGWRWGLPLSWGGLGNGRVPTRWPQFGVEPVNVESKPPDDKCRACRPTPPKAHGIRIDHPQASGRAGGAWAPDAWRRRPQRRPPAGCGQQQTRQQARRRSRRG